MLKDLESIEEVLFTLFPRCVLLTVEGYLGSIQYSFSASWTLPIACITSDQKLLYICDFSKSLCVYNLEGQLIKKKSTLLNHPTDIDLYQNCLYIIDLKHVFIFNLQFQFLSSFPLLPYTDSIYKHLKVDQNLIFITLEVHQVYVYVREGKLKHTIGSTASSSKQGEFYGPRGLTVNNSTLYICDCGNHRIQSLNKNDFSFCTKWGSYGTDNGQFRYPYSICNWENILYVGDLISVQLFTSEGTFLSRLGYKKIGNKEGQFNHAWGLCCVRDRLYVSDLCNRRIQVFQRMTNSEMEKQKLEMEKTSKQKDGKNGCIIH